MSKHDLLKFPDDLEGNLRALLRAPPPPHDIPGSRKAAPKTRKRKRPKGTAATGTYAYEMAPVQDRAKPKKRKAAKKR